MRSHPDVPSRLRRTLLLVAALAAAGPVVSTGAQPLTRAELLRRIDRKFVAAKHRIDPRVLATRELGILLSIDAVEPASPHDGDQLVVRYVLTNFTLVGLDQAQFAACRANDRTQAIVTENLASGERLGITGTPAFFINGRFLNGAQPDEVFQRVIDEELEALRLVNDAQPELPRK
jgi:DSBA-like thioredoxin domain